MSKFFRKTVSWLLMFSLTLTTLLVSFSAYSPSSKAADIPPSGSWPITFCDIYRKFNIYDYPIIESVFKALTGIDNPWYEQFICRFSEKVFADPQDEIFGERYTYAQVDWVINSLFLHMPIIGGFFKNTGWVGNAATLLEDALKNIFSLKPTTEKDLAQLGQLGTITSLFGFPFEHRPASFSTWSQDTLSRLNLITPAHAQQGGYGFLNSTAVLSLWGASRNVAYFASILLLIVAGFLVIFRIKINPQTIVTLQMLIPKLVVTLVAITFSYAIAGLMIDLVYLVLSVGISFLSTAGIVNNVTDAISYFAVPGGFYKLFLYFLIGMIAATITMIVGLPLLGNLISIIFLIASIFLLFKIWFHMLKSYVSLLGLIIAGPVMIMLGIIPGNQGFGGWLRRILAQISVFIVIPAMFLLVVIIWQTDFGGWSSQVLAFTMSLISQPTGIQSSIHSGLVTPDLPFWNGSGWIVQYAMGFAIFSVIPKTADMIRDALKMPAFKYGSAIGQALEPGYDQTAGRFMRGQQQAAQAEATRAKAANDIPTQIDAERRASDWQRREAQTRKTLLG